MNLHDRITQGYLAEALEILLKITENTDFYEDCAMQSASFHRLERDLEKGLITPQDADLTKNRITHALLSILKRYEAEYGKVEGKIETKISQNKNPKTEKTMAKNNAEINGNNNTVIQDVKNSTIQTGGTHIQKSGVPAWLVAFLVGIIVVVIGILVGMKIFLDSPENKSNDPQQIQNNSQIQNTTVVIQMPENQKKEGEKPKVEQKQEAKPKKIEEKGEKNSEMVDKRSSFLTSDQSFNFKKFKEELKGKIDIADCSAFLELVEEEGKKGNILYNKDIFRGLVMKASNNQCANILGDLRAFILAIQEK